MIQLELETPLGKALIEENSYSINIRHVNSLSLKPTFEIRVIPKVLNIFSIQG